MVTTWASNGDNVTTWGAYTVTTLDLQKATFSIIPYGYIVRSAKRTPKEMAVYMYHKKLQGALGLLHRTSGVLGRTLSQSRGHSGRVALPNRGIHVLYSREPLVGSGCRVRRRRCLCLKSAPPTEPRLNWAKAPDSSSLAPAGKPSPALAQAPLGYRIKGHAASRPSFNPGFGNQTPFTRLPAGSYHTPLAGEVTSFRGWGAIVTATTKRKKTL